MCNFNRQLRGSNYFDRHKGVVHPQHRQGESGPLLMKKGEERNLTTNIEGSKGSELNSPSSIIWGKKKREGRDKHPNSNSFEGEVEDQPR